MTDDTDPPIDDLSIAGQRDSSEPHGSVSVDTVLDLLAHRHRRELLGYVIDSAGETSPIDDVTTSLCRQDSERTDTCSDRDRIELSLRHTHLPKLVAAGVIEYDSRSRELRYRRHDRLETVLECLRSMEPA